MNYAYNKDDNKKRHIFLGVTAVICFLFAASVLPFVFPQKSLSLTADIMLCFVCALPAFTDTKKAAIYALAAGFAADLFINVPTCFSPLVFLACVYLSSLCQRYFSRVGTLAIAVSAIPCFIAKHIVRIVVVALTSGGAAAGEYLGIVPMSLAVDFACAIVLSFVMRIVSKKLRLKQIN